MSHTPGPWEWKIGSDGWDGERCYLEGADDALVLDATGYDAWAITFGQAIGLHGMTPVEEQPFLPDARLIAAAPELLAALKFLLEVGADDDRRIAAEYAIAKAEGVIP
jgi:hypothetical protein